MAQNKHCYSILLAPSSWKLLDVMCEDYHRSEFSKNSPLRLRARFVDLEKLCATSAQELRVIKRARRFNSSLQRMTRPISIKFLASSATLKLERHFGATIPISLIESFCTRCPAPRDFRRIINDDNGSRGRSSAVSGAQSPDICGQRGQMQTSLDYTQAGRGLRGRWPSELWFQLGVH